MKKSIVLVVVVIVVVAVIAGFVYYKNENNNSTTYKVNFLETGLPSGSTWFVNLSSGQKFSSTTSIISFNEPNGTYQYIISTSNSKYFPLNASGTFTIKGISYFKSVEFNLEIQPSGLISVKDADQATNQIWYESLNGTVGITNITSFYDTLNNITSPGSPVPFPFNQSYLISLKYVNFVALISASKSSLAFGYGVYNSFDLAAITNSTIMQNLSKSSSSINETRGSVSGAFYAYIYQLNNGNYSALIYAIYVNTIIMGYYFGNVLLTSSQFAQLVYDQVQVLNSYNEIISVNGIVSPTIVDSYLGSSWNQEFIGSFETHNINMSSNYVVNVLYHHNSDYQKLFNTYKSFNQFAIAGYTSINNGSMGIGYGFSTNQTAVLDAYNNFTAFISTANGVSTLSLNNTYNGMTYSLIVAQVTGNTGSYTISILFGIKGGYLTGIMCYSLTPDTNALINILEAESNLL